VQRDLCSDEEANPGVADFEQLTTEGTEEHRGFLSYHH